MRKDSILQNFYNSKLPKAKKGGPVDRNGKPNLSQIIEANKDKTSHITRKAKSSLPKEKFGGGMFPEYHSYAPPRMANGGGLLSRTVTCSNCGWSWKAVDGGSDPMTCHKCGGMIKMQQGGSMPRFDEGGPGDDVVANEAKAKEFLRNWYTGRAELPQFKDVATARLKTLNDLNYKFASGSDNKAHDQIAYFPVEGGKNIYLTDPKDPNFNADGLGILPEVIAHEYTHALDYNNPQENRGFFRPVPAKVAGLEPSMRNWMMGMQRVKNIDEKGKPLSWWRSVSGYDPGNPDRVRTQNNPEPSGVINMFRMSEGINPKQVWDEKNIMPYINKYSDKKYINDHTKENYTPYLIQTWMKQFGNNPKVIADMLNKYVKNDGTQALDMGRYGGIKRMDDGGQGPCPTNMYWDTLSKKCVLRPAPFVTSDEDEYNRRLQLASDSTNAAVDSRLNIQEANLNSANQKTVTDFNQNAGLANTDKSYKDKPKVAKRVTKYNNTPSQRYTTEQYKENLVKQGFDSKAANDFVDNSASVISGNQTINPVAITNYSIDGKHYDEKGNLIDTSTFQYIPEFQEAKQEVKYKETPSKYSVTYSTPDGKQHTFPYIYDYETWKLINDRFVGSRAYRGSQEKGDKSEASTLLAGLTEEDFNNILNEEYIEGNTKPMDNLFDSKPTSSIASVEYVQANNKKYGGNAYTKKLDYFNPKFNEMGGRITTSAMNLRKYVNGGALCKDMFGNTIDCPPGYTAGSTVFATQSPNVSSSTSAGVPQRNAEMLNDLRFRQSVQNQASVGPARMQTLDEQRLNQQRKQQFVQNNPNTQLNDQNTIVGINPNRGFQGQPLTPNAKRFDKGLGHIARGLDAAYNLTGAGIGINALRNRLGKKVSTLALTEEEMAQAMAEGIDEAGSYGISPDQYRKMLQDQQLRQQSGKMVRGMEKNPSDQHPIDEWFRSSNSREFGDEMRGLMRKLGYEPTNPKDVENFRTFFNNRSGQLFLNNQKPVGYGQTLTNMFSNPMNKYGGSIDQYGPGGQTTDGCGPGFDRHPILGTCIPNGWNPPTQTQVGPTVQAAENMRRARMLNDVHEIAAKARYKQLQPNQQQATVGRSYGDEPWRQRQAAEIRRQEAMKNTELAQTFASLTPSGDINAGVIGANTFVNMTPGIGIIPASSRLATFVNSVGPNNPRKGENAYYSKDNSFGENALGALNFVGDIGMLGIGSPFKGLSAEPTPGVTQAGFNPIRGTKKLINKAYGAFDEMFGGSGDEVLFNNLENKPKPSNVTPEAEVSPRVERTYPFENQAEIVHNNNTYFVNKDNPTEIMMMEEGQRTLTHASEADIPKVQEKYSATLPKETTTPAKTEPVQQTTTPAQTSTPKPVSTLEENLNKARAQSDPTPPPSTTEKNTGQAAPATPPKKGNGFGQVVKPVLKGAGVLGGIGLGMYGLNKLMSNSAPPTKPFSNSPTNNVTPSDTNFYSNPTIDTSMNQYADTSGYAAPVNIDSSINAPLTPEEIRLALDTSGVPSHRYGGQRMRYGGYKFQNGGSISIEGLQNALNNIKI